MGIEIKIEKITPNGAAKILASNNVVNRKLRERMINMIAQDIKQGLFNGHNGETIKFGEDGQLKDGQHRLAAIVEANVPTELAVAYGVPNDSQATIDMGARRHYYDILHMRGYTDSTALAAVIKQVTLRHLNMNMSDGKLLSFMQMDQVFDKYPELTEITREARSLYDQSKLVPMSILGLCTWMFGHIDEEDASFFMARLSDGQNLEIGDPIYTLRKRLTVLKEGDGKINARTILGCILIAWNAYRDGKKLHIIRFKSGGAKPDPLPEPH